MNKTEKQFRKGIRNLINNNINTLINSLNDYAVQSIDEQIKKQDNQSKAKKVTLEINNQSGNYSIKITCYFQVGINRFMYTHSVYVPDKDCFSKNIKSYEDVFCAFKNTTNTIIRYLINDHKKIIEKNQPVYCKKLFPSASERWLWGDFVTLEDCADYLTREKSSVKLCDIANKILNSDELTNDKNHTKIKRTCEFLKYKIKKNVFYMHFKVYTHSKYMNTKTEEISVSCNPLIEMILEKSVEECSEYFIAEFEKELINKINEINSRNGIVECYDYDVCEELKETDDIAKYVCQQLNDFANIVTTSQNTSIKVVVPKNSPSIKNSSICLNKDEQYIIQGFNIRAIMSSTRKGILKQSIPLLYNNASQQKLKKLLPPKNHLECCELVKIMECIYQGIALPNNVENRATINIVLADNGFTINTLDIKLFYNYKKQRFTSIYPTDILSGDEEIISAKTLMDIVINTVLQRQQELAEKLKHLSINPIQLDMINAMKRYNTRGVNKTELLSTVKSTEVTGEGKERYFYKLVSNDFDIVGERDVRNYYGTYSVYYIEKQWQSFDFSCNVVGYSINDFDYVTSETKRKIIDDMVSKANNSKSCWKAFSFIKKMPAKFIAEFCKSDVAVPFFSLLEGEEAEFAQLFISGISGCKTISEVLFRPAMLKKLTIMSQKSKDVYDVIDELRMISKDTVFSWLDSDDGNTFCSCLDEDAAQELSEVLADMPNGKKYIKKLKLPKVS